MAFSTIQADTADGVLTITLDRADCLNAFCAELSIELTAALRLANRDRAIRCVILTGAGKAFCAGQDLRQIETPSGPDAPDHSLGVYLRDHVNPVIVRLRTMEKPVLAAVNGVAAGAGVSLALAADLRICAASASFRMAFGDLGLVPDAGATLTLVQHLGYARAAEMCLLGETVSAQRALEMGLVNRVVDDAALPATAWAWAARLAALPPIALGLTKRALNHAWNNSLEDQLEYEALLQTTAARTADHREALAAFREKRPPTYTGK